jgi:ribosomal protein S18 acetylase RimI-like enzyme
MGWTLTDAVDDFLTAAGPLLAAHPAQNTVLLTVTHRIVESGPATFGGSPARFGWWRKGLDTAVGGAFLETAPYPVRLSVMPPAAAAALATELGPSVHGVGGEGSTVDAFVDAWKTTTGGSATVRLNQWLYRLGELVAPIVPGTARRADRRDRDLLVRWFDEFFTELDGVRDDTEGAVDSRLAGGAVWLWEDGDEPVAFAAATPVVAGMARIGPVYTPPDRRRQGYASAATAVASADAVARGAEQVLLYADAANPTSNSIYRKLGYRQVGDDLIVDLHAPS